MRKRRLLAGLMAGMLLTQSVGGNVMSFASEDWEETASVSEDLIDEDISEEEIAEPQDAAEENAAEAGAVEEDAVPELADVQADVAEDEDSLIEDMDDAEDAEENAGEEEQELAADHAGKKPVEFTYTPGHEYVVTQGENGWVTSDSNNIPYYYYDTWNLTENRDGDTVEILFEGEDEPVQYLYDSSMGSYVDVSDPDDILGYWVYASDSQMSQEKNPWKLNGDNTIQWNLNYFDAEMQEEQILTAEVPVTMVGDILSVQFVPAQEYRWIENTHGGLNGDQWYYNFWYENGDQIVLEKTSGQEVFTYLSDENLFYSDEGNTLDTMEFAYDSDQGSRAWGMGEECYFTMFYKGVSAKIPVIIEESPLDAISFEPAKPWQIIENTHGDSIWEQVPEGDEWKDVEYFQYYTPNWKTGDRLILIKSGDEIVYEYNGSDFVNEEDDSDQINTGDISLHFTQNYQNQWTVGNTYDGTLSYLGKFCRVSVEIIPDLLDSIEYVTAEDYQWVEHTHGNWYNQGTEDEWYYYWFPGYQEGDQLILHGTNGDTVVYIYSTDESQFVNTETGETIPTDGDEGVIWEDTQWNEEEHWDHIGDYAFGIRYRAKKAKLSVTIIENPIAAIQYVPAEAYEYIFEVNGNLEMDGDGEEFFYYSDSPHAINGDQLILVMRDGTEIIYTYYSNNGRFINESDKKDYFYGDEVSFDCNQYGTHWTLGSDQYVTVTYQGVRSNPLPITIIENPVESISYEPAEALEVVQYQDSYDSWEDEDGTRHYRYNLPAMNMGDALVVTYTGKETPVTYLYNKNKGTFVNAEDETDILTGSDVTFHYVEEGDEGGAWDELGTYYFGVTYLGKSYDEIPVTLVENPIEGISFVPVEPYELYENADGDWVTVEDEEGNETEIFRYNTPSFKNGDQMILIMKGDAPDVVYTYSDRQGCFISEKTGDRIIEGYWMEIEDQEEHPLVPGSENKATFGYQNFRVEVPVTVVENPIESISFTPAEPYVLYLEYGFWENWDENDEPYNHYDIPEYQDGDFLTLTYTDGTRKEYVYDEDTESFLNREDRKDQIEEYKIRRIDTQRKEHWDSETTYQITVTYMSRETTVDVEMKHLPIREISFASEKGLSVTLGMDGNWEYDWDDEKYFWFECPEFQTGDVLTLTWNDDTKTPYTYDENTRCFASEDGEDTISTSDLSRWYDIEEDQYYEHFVPGTVKPMILSYLGLRCEAEVSILDNPVASISLEPVEPYSAVEGERGRIDEDTGSFRYYNPGFQDGDKLTIHYTDDTVKTYVFVRNLDSFVNEEDGEDTIRDYELDFFSDQDEDPWDVGEHSFTVSYTGRETEVSFTVLASEVAAIEYELVRPITIYENTLGDWDSDGAFEFFVYYEPHTENGNVLKVTWQSEAKGTAEYVLDWGKGGYINKEDPTDVIYEYELTFESNQYDVSWELGEHVWTVSYQGKKTTIPVTIVKNEIVDASFTQVKPLEATLENEEDGEWISVGGETYFWYDVHFQIGDQFIVTYQDGSVRTYQYQIVDEMFAAFVNTEDATDRLENQYLTIDVPQYAQHWTEAGTYTATPGYAEKKTPDAIKVVLKAPEEAEADYSEVDAALKTIPSDLSIYTDESVKAVTAAKDAVIRGKKASEQPAVDDMAKAINDAVAALVEKEADYSEVDAALKTIPSDLSIYTDESVKAVTAAKDAVVREKKVSEQAAVDAMAKAINDAVAALVEKAADYSKVDAALKAIPANLSVYTDASVKKVNDAKNAVKRGYNITQQAQVDVMAKAITDAVASLKEKDADYSKVDAALKAIPANLSQYTDASVKKVNDAKNAVKRGYNITQQAQVDAMAKAINDAVKALVKKPVTPTKLQLIAAYNGAYGIGVKWVALTGATEYTIWQKFNGVWKAIKTVKPNDSSLQKSGNTLMYTDRTVQKGYGKGYIYSVSAKVGSTVVDYDKTGVAIYRLNPPTLKKATNNKAGTVTVTWSKVFGKTETNGAYDLQYATEADAKAGKWTSVPQKLGHTASSTTVTGLKKGTKYIFRIRCSKTNKDRGTFFSEYSKWLSVTVKK